MPRDYPPMSNATAIGQAQGAAIAWNGPPPHTNNAGNQGTEYITFGQAGAVKEAWRQLGTQTINGVTYDCVASDSQSALGNEIDLKLRLPGSHHSAFNYHVALDSQIITKQQKEAQLNVMRDNWRIVNNLRRAEYRAAHGGANPSASFDLPFPFK